MLVVHEFNKNQSLQSIENIDPGVFKTGHLSHPCDSNQNVLTATASVKFVLPGNRKTKEVVSH
jgi:hypothetical protein